MKRTHVMHHRDNRRAKPYYDSQYDHRRNDSRPCLEWRRLTDGLQELSINGERIGYVKDVERPGFDILGDPVDPHVAIIAEAPDTEYAFNSLDAARFFLEQQAAKRFLAAA